MYPWSWADWSLVASVGFLAVSGGLCLWRRQANLPLLLLLLGTLFVIAGLLLLRHVNESLGLAVEIPGLAIEIVGFALIVRRFRIQRAKRTHQ